MVAEYMSELYQPAHKLWNEISADNFDQLRERTVWEERTRASWSQIKFLGLGEAPDDHVTSGSTVPLRATLNLAGLKPDDVRVEAVIGKIGMNGDLERPHALPLVPVESNGNTVTFANEFTVQETGRVGYSVRVSPNHTENPLTRPCNALIKWISD